MASSPDGTLGLRWGISRCCSYHLGCWQEEKVLTYYTIKEKVCKMLVLTRPYAVASLSTAETCPCVQALVYETKCLVHYAWWLMACLVPRVPECALESNSSRTGSSHNKLAAASSVITGKQESEKQSLSFAVIFMVKCLDSCSITGLSATKGRTLEKVKGIRYWHGYSSPVYLHLSAFNKPTEQFLMHSNLLYAACLNRSLLKSLNYLILFFWIGMI